MPICRCPRVKNRDYLLLGPLLGLLLPSLALASTDDLMSEEDLYGAIPSVTSATRLEQELHQAPVAMTIIDQQMIDASGAVNIADLFKLVPGFQSYQVHANKSGVTSHGQGDSHPGRLEVMIDGRSVYLAALSTVDWSALGVSLDDIDHIEVVRGPSVVTHGSNAFLGAINIITRTPLQDQGGSVRLLGGSLDTQAYAGRYNDSIGSFNYRVGINYHQNEGTGDGFDEDTPTLPQRMEDGAELTQLNFSGLYTPNLTDSWRFQLGLSDGSIGVGNANHPDSFTPRSLESNYQNVTWVRQLSEGDELQVQGYRNYVEYDNSNEVMLFDYARQQLPALSGVDDATLEALVGAPDQAIDLGPESGIAIRHDLEAQYTSRLSSQLRAVGGVGVRVDSIEADQLLEQNGRLSETLYRLFTNLEWQPQQQLTMNLGAMLEHNETTGARLSPRLGLNWQVAPAHTLRAAASLAYRTPSLVEQHSYVALTLPSNGQVVELDSYSPDQINPERIRAYELGYLMQAPALNSVFDIKLYVEQVDDAIAEYLTDAPAGVEHPLAGDGKAFEGRNNAAWTTKGAELQWRIEPWSGGWWYLSYAYADAQGQFDRGKNEKTGGDININALDQRVPAHDLSLLFSQQLGAGFETSVGFYRQTSVEWSKGSELDPYNRLDGRIAKRFGFGRVKGSVELILQSFNAPYTEFENNNTVDNRGFVRLKLDFL